MKKVLHVVAGMGLGGTETYLMNIYRNIDRNYLQFDFLTYYKTNENGYYDEEIKSLGGNIQNIESISKVNPITFVNNIRKVIRENNYVAVHAHTSYNIGFAMLAAKLEGIPIRIAHSHRTKSPVKLKIYKKIYAYIMLQAINKFANRFCACSQEAAKFLFNSQNLKNNYIFMPNAVDIQKFIQNKISNNKIIKDKLNIPINSKVIGHIGRYGKAKNHEFIVELFKDIMKKREDIYLLLIGDGPTRNKIEQKIKKYGIENNVKILGIRKDVPELIGIMDIFILPSLFEGFGIVLLEAQASGVPCVVSENIQKETDIGLGLINWVNLSDMDKWINTIESNLGQKIEDKNIILNAIEKSPYKIEEVVKKFYQLYELEIPKSRSK